MKRLVKARHWQIFVGLFGASLLLKEVDLRVMTGELNEIYSVLTPISYYSIWMGWTLITASFLNKRINKGRGLNLKVPTAIGLILIVNLGVFQFLIIDIGRLEYMRDNMAVTIAFILYVMTSLLVICGYAAKTLKLHETNSEIDINDYFAEMLSFLIWPIGIWFIQPRINRVFATAS